MNTGVGAGYLGWDPAAEVRVLKIQRKLHQWAVDDAGRRFDDVFNLVLIPLC